jgi:hypothetical protein
MQLDLHTDNTVVRSMMQPNDRNLFQEHTHVESTNHFANDGPVTHVSLVLSYAAGLVLSLAQMSVVCL